MNSVSLLLQRNELTLFIANNKTQAFKWKLKFWKTFNIYQEFNSLSIVEAFYDDIGNDINVI